MGDIYILILIYISHKIRGEDKGVLHGDTGPPAFLNCPPAVDVGVS